MHYSGCHCDVIGTQGSLVWWQEMVVRFPRALDIRSIALILSVTILFTLIGPTFYRYFSWPVKCYHFFNVGYKMTNYWNHDDIKQTVATHFNSVPTMCSSDTECFLNYRLRKNSWCNLELEVTNECVQCYRLSEKCIQYQHTIQNWCLKKTWGNLK